MFESSLELMGALSARLDDLVVHEKRQVIKLELDDALMLWLYGWSFGCEEVNDMMELMNEMSAKNEIHGLNDVLLQN